MLALNKNEEQRQYLEQIAQAKYEELLRQLSERRKSLGVSLGRMEEETQIYKSYIHRVEQGHINTSVKKLIVLCEILGLEVTLKEKV